MMVYCNWDLFSWNLNCRNLLDAVLYEAIADQISCGEG